MDAGRRQEPSCREGWGRRRGGGGARGACATGEFPGSEMGGRWPRTEVGMSAGGAGLRGLRRGRLGCRWVT